MRRVLVTLSPDLRLVACGLGLLGMVVFLTLGGWADEHKAAAAGYVTGKSEAGIAYMHGGVGKPERDKMEAMAQKKGFTLKVNCAATNRAYLANVDVVVRNAAGDKLLEVTTAGPWLFAMLPEGTYHVTATFQGEAKAFKDVSIGKQRVTLQPRWELKEKQPA